MPFQYVRTAQPDEHLTRCSHVKRTQERTLHLRGQPGEPTEAEKKRGGRRRRGNWHLIAVRTWAAITEQCGAATAMMMNCFLHTLIGGIIKLWPAWNAAWKWEQGTGNCEVGTGN